MLILVRVRQSRKKAGCKRAASNGAVEQANIGSKRYCNLEEKSYEFCNS
jgi:hypothetical protein